MRIYDIAFHNLNRRRGRMMFLALSLAVATGTITAMFSLTTALRDSVADQLDQYGANIIILPHSESLAVSYGGFNLPGITYKFQALSQDDLGKIRSIPYQNRLSVVAPKLLKSFSAGGHEYVVAGVDLESELRLKRWWQIEGKKPENSRQVLLGFAAAKRHGLIRDVNNVATPKDKHAHSAASSFSIEELPEPVRIGEEEFEAVGIIRETGTNEDGFIFADLAAVQRVFHAPREITLVEISALCNGCPIEDIVSQLSAVLPNARVSAVQQAVRARLQTVEKLVNFSYALAAIVTSIAFLVVSASMMSSVAERIREIGILRAIGFRKSHVLQALFTEVTLVSVAGGIFGCLAGFAAAVLASPYFVEATVSVKPDFRLFLASLVLTLVVALLASVYPASRAARLDPVEALRSL